MTDTKKIQPLPVLLSLCLTLATVACDNGQSSMMSAGNDMSAVSGSNAKHSRERRTESFLKEKNSGQAQIKNTSQGVLPQMGESKTVQNSSLVASRDLSKEKSSATGLEHKNAIAPEAQWKNNLDHQKNLHQASVETSSIVDVATLIPEGSAGTLNELFPANHDRFENQTALTISQVDVVVSKVKTYLESFSDIDLADEETKKATSQKTQRLQVMFGSMMEQATGVEKNKVFAKLEQQHKILLGVGSMLERDISGVEISEWIDAVNGKTGASAILSVVDGSVALSRNMGVVYCFIEKNQMNLDAQTGSDCKNQRHLDIALVRVVDHLLEDLRNGQQYAAPVAASVIQMTSSPKKLAKYLSVNEQEMVQKISTIIQKQANIQISNTDYAMDDSNVKGKR